MPPETRPVPVTAHAAAGRLDRSVGTIYSWVTRFNARRLGRVSRTKYYDLNDLAVIEREIRHGHPVPATPEERDAIADACPLHTQQPTQVAA